jgi:hypothetical protein
MFEIPKRERLSAESEAMVERAAASAPPLCDGLIDQGRSIGGDPAGYSCGRAATATHWQGGVCWRVCAGCKALLDAGAGRVTLPAWRARLGEG